MRRAKAESEQKRTDPLASLSRLMGSNNDGPTGGRFMTGEDVWLGSPGVAIGLDTSHDGHQWAMHLPGGPMQYSILIDTEADLATIVVNGIVDAAGMSEALDNLAGHPDYHAGIPRLWDARTADLSNLRREDFETIATRAEAKDLSQSGTHVAFVARTILDFGIGRMFELTEGEELPVTMKVFRDMDEATTWLLAAG
jgi:hypothetical protein